MDGRGKGGGRGVKRKVFFEKVMLDVGRKIKSYHTNNILFQSKVFRESLVTENYSLTFSRVGAQYQNGVAERAIKTIIWLVRTMMIHSIII